MKNEKKIKSMQAGRKKYLKETAGLICNIGEDIQIFVDEYQFILKFKNRPNSVGFFSTIEEVLEEISRRKEKEFMLKDDRLNLESVMCAIDNARIWFEKEIQPFLPVEIKTNHNDTGSI
jgi:hypothetical protein